MAMILPEVMLPLDMKNLILSMALVAAPQKPVTSRLSQDEPLKIQTLPSSMFKTDFSPHTRLKTSFSRNPK